jgi:hypothetical protein
VVNKANHRSRRAASYSGAIESSTRWILSARPLDATEIVVSDDQVSRAAGRAIP